MHSSPGGQLLTRQHAKIRTTNLPRRRSPWIAGAIAALLPDGLTLYAESPAKADPALSATSRKPSMKGTDNAQNHSAWTA
jgi:hypothetical protein